MEKRRIIQLSIIVPVYNVNKYIIRCIDSIYNQISRHVEIIVVNDGSTDNSLELVQEYAEGKDEIRIINQNNKGLSGARNTGLHFSNGLYVWFVDSDDYICSSAVATILNIINCDNSQLDLIAFNTKCVYENNSSATKIVVRSSTKSGIINSNQLYGCYKWPYSGAQFYVYRKRFLNESGIFFKEGIFFEDILFTPQIIVNAKSIYYLNDALYCYSIRNCGSIMSTPYNLKRTTHSIYIANSLLKLYNESTSKYRWILKDAACKVIGHYYGNYRDLTGDERKEARKNFLKQPGYFKALLNFRNIKYMYSYIQMIIC